LSGNITPVNKGAVEHYLKMASVPQTKKPRGPPSDFERTASKWSVQQVGKAKYHANVEYRARAEFREENNLTEEDLKIIEEGPGIAPPPLLWPFRLGYDLVHLEQVPALPTRLRQLH
jgi:hypothetical protein